MNEVSFEKSVSDIEPEEEYVVQSKEKKNEDPSASPEVAALWEEPTSIPAVENSGEADVAEPPVDWFEPLEEDDDALSDGKHDLEEESLAGESERSEGMAGSERTNRRVYKLHAPRRKRSNLEEGWFECTALGEGWKRKEVVRRSGSSIGQKDVYYLSPSGDRVRSRVELVSVLEAQLDLTNFDYKTGRFYEGEAPPVRVRHRVKRKVRERSSSESSWMERGEGADTPDSYQRLTPNLAPKQVNTTLYQTSFYSQIMTASSNQVSRVDHSPDEEKIKLPPPSLLSKPLLLPAINGDIATEDSTLVCAKCGISFIGTWYDKQRKKPCCPTCWASKAKEHPMIRFRKWIPCGQCVGCHHTTNCGQCANCKHGLQSPDTRKRLCRKRKCICPIRKSSGSGNIVAQKSSNDQDMFDDNVSVQSEVTDSQHMSLKSSDTENFSVSVDVDDEEDMSTDDDDDWHKKRKRRACGECKACLCRKDCGTCDFCVDKPKFGGSNKKRQKCRLRQCQRQAMRHLLPFQMGQGEFLLESDLLPGRPKPHYTYSRKPGFKKNKELGYDSDEDDDSNFLPMSWSSELASASKPISDLDLKNNHSTSQQLNHDDFRQRNGLSDRVTHISSNNVSEIGQPNRWDTEKPPEGRVGKKQAEEDEEEELPMIDQIFSLADNTGGSGADTDKQLLKLLHSLRTSALPILWYAIMVEGPQLQLIQCSKQSSMADTIVLIDPGFCYQVTVQKQPLLPTHPLYDQHPSRLSSVTEVVSLLLNLEQYAVCHGLPLPDSLSIREPIILERASTCDFLVRKNVSICANCRALQGP